MIEALLRKMRLRDPVSDEEERLLRKVLEREKIFKARESLVRQGDVVTESLCLLDGFACRYKDLRSGQRQILELNLSGDFVDLHAFMLKRLDHGIEALTDCRVAIVSHGDLQAITEQHPHLARLLWFQTAMDAAIHREWVTSLGRRSAVGRLAHLFCELEIRLRIVGLSDGGAFALPLTQIDLSDIAGLSAVHTNRSLQSLRRDGLLRIGHGKVKILDLAQLAAIAEFDPDYLYVPGGAR